MAQYKTGSVSVTNGSQTVTGLGTLWSSEVSSGDIFTVVGENAWYEVGSVDSDTQITLSASYAGVSASGAAYAITRDFTTNYGWPYPQKGDIETASLIKRAFEDIDAKLVLTNTDGDVTVAGDITLSAGTANGVAYLNGSKVLTTGSALTFDGTNFGVNSPILAARTLSVKGRAAFTATANDSQLAIFSDGSTNGLYSTYNTTGSYLPMTFWINDAEQMRLTSTGLGIGTSSPAYKLQVDGASTAGFVTPIVAKNPSTNAASSVKMGFDAGGTIWGEIGASYNSNDPYMAFFVRAGSEKMRITDAGNLGLGVTPSAWASGWKSLQMQGGAFYSQNILGMAIIGNAYYNGTNYIYSNSYAATKYDQYNGTHYWYTAPSGTAGNAISFTQAMTLHASGSLSVGNTVDGGAKTLNVGITAATTNTLVGRVNFQGYSTAYGAGVASYIPSGAPGIDWQDLRFYTSEGPSAINVERARIDSSGHLIVPNGVTLGTAVGTYNAANTLNDYEEGTWTPTAEVGGVSVTCTGNQCVYTKVGNVVHVRGSVSVTRGTQTGGLRVKGFPYSIPTGTFPVSAFWSVTNSAGYTDALVFNNAYDMYLTGQSGLLTLTDANMPTTVVSFVYNFSWQV